MSSRQDLSSANSRSANPIMSREDVYNSFEKNKYLNNYDDVKYYHDSGHSTLRYSNGDLDPRLSHYSFLNSKSPVPINETTLNTVKLNGTDITGSFLFF